MCMGLRETGYKNLTRIKGLYTQCYKREASICWEPHPHRLIESQTI